MMRFFSKRGKPMRDSILLGTAAAALSLSAPLLAQGIQDATATSGTDKSASELDAVTTMFGNMFKKDDTPIEPMLLSKAERVAGAVVPIGSYRKIMAETFQQIIEPMMAGMDEVPLSTIATFAGVSEEDIVLKEGATLSELMLIIDPYYRQRNRAMMAKITDIMIDLSDEIEPSIRTGMARAYARRFSASELEAAALFYETESGAKIAGESLAIFASPEVMSASMEMMPKFLDQFLGAIEDITKGNDSLPPPREFGDLNDEELGKMAELMGFDRDSMTKSHDDYFDEAVAAAEAAIAAAEAAAAEATIDADCEADDECYSKEETAQWADPKNWSAEERETVAKLEAEHQAVFDKYFAAQEAAIENAKMRLKKD